MAPAIYAGSRGGCVPRRGYRSAKALMRGAWGQGSPSASPARHGAGAIRKDRASNRRTVGRGLKGRHVLSGRVFPPVKQGSGDGF